MAAADPFKQDSAARRQLREKKLSFEPRPGAWHRDVAPRDRSDLLLGLALVAVAQVRENIGDVGELLLEIALE